MHCKSTDPLKLLSVNCHSIVNKTADLEYFISIDNLDMVALAESRLHDGICDSEFVPPDFEVYRRDRNNSGDSAELLFKKKLKVVCVNDPASLEGLLCKIFCDQHCVIVDIYRPPGSNL